MLRSEAETVFRRCMEDTKAEFTEEQIQCLIMAIVKIGGRMVEEGVASSGRGGGPGSGRRQGYFSD